LLREHLERLASQVRKCEKCDLALRRERAIPGEGPLDAEIFLVGQAPSIASKKTTGPFGVLQDLFCATSWEEQR
jgi:DNA polymerase